MLSNASDNVFRTARFNEFNEFVFAAAGMPRPLQVVAGLEVVFLSMQALSKASGFLTCMAVKADSPQVEGGAVV